jgi:hypothetical protein
VQEVDNCFAFPLAFMGQEQLNGRLADDGQVGVVDLEDDSPGEMQA